MILAAKRMGVLFFFFTQLNFCSYFQNFSLRIICYTTITVQSKVSVSTHAEKGTHFMRLTYLFAAL